MNYQEIYTNIVKDRFIKMIFLLRRIILTDSHFSVPAVECH